MHDIYKPSFNYLFGLASLAAGVSVFSFHRQDPANVACEFWNGTKDGVTRLPGDEEKLVRRASATLCHELGHTFGLKHCVYYQCLMQGSNSLEESEGRGPLKLCPVCLRKVCWSVDIAPVEHYTRLLEHYDRHAETYGEAREFVQQRLNRLGKIAMPPCQPVADKTDTADAEAGGDSRVPELCESIELRDA